MGIEEENSAKNRIEWNGMQGIMCKLEMGMCVCIVFAWLGVKSS